MGFLRSQIKSRMLMLLKLLLHLDNTFDFAYCSVSKTKILALKVGRSLRDFAWIWWCETGYLDCFCKKKQQGRADSSECHYVLGH